MSDTKIFSLPDGGSNGSNSMLAMLPALLQRQGVDPGLLALCQNRSDNGWGGDGIFGILLLFILMGAFNGGWGGGFGGFGGNRGFGGNGQGGVVPILNNDANTAVIMQAVQRNGFDISTLATALNTSSDAVQAAISALGTQLCSVGNNLGLGQKDLQFAVLNGNQSILTQLCDCCCSLKTLITEQGYQNQLATVNQTNTLQGAINFTNSSVERGFAAEAYERQAQTCALKGEISALKQYIGDQFCQDRMDQMRRENQNLRDQVQAFQLSASQQQQTQNIINQVRPCPQPAYWVPNPFGCGCNNYGYPYNGNNCGGCNNGCGC